MESPDALLARANSTAEPTARAQMLQRAGTAFELAGDAARAAQCFYQAYQLAPSMAAAEGAARAYSAARQWAGAVGWLDAAVSQTQVPAEKLRLLKLKGRILHTELRDAAGTQRVLAEARALEAALAAAGPVAAATPGPTPVAEPSAAPLPAPGHQRPDDLTLASEPDEPALELAYERRVAPPPASPEPEPSPAPPPEPALREESPASGPKLPLKVLAAAAVVLGGVYGARALLSPAPPPRECPTGSAFVKDTVNGEVLSGCRTPEGRFGGSVEVHDSRGTLIARRTWVNGELSGPAEEFDATGVVRSGAYVKGLRDGVWVSQRQGLRLEERTWVKGVPSGTWLQYDPKTGAKTTIVEGADDAGAAPLDAGGPLTSPPALEVTSTDDLMRLYGGHRLSHWRTVLSAADSAGTGALVRLRAARAGLTVTPDGGLAP